ncbi:hypothetical protein [Chamaesiphon minutus]|uniref:hypothetical protein n=1 Tax=Chamaesiphon minutus TaxID=1173032 RepID=UPI0012F9FEE6|nr:hypothetical protein [Chamaesiphon minutus]
MNTIGIQVSKFLARNSINSSSIDPNYDLVHTKLNQNHSTLFSFSNQKPALIATLRLFFPKMEVRQRTSHHKRRFDSSAVVSQEVLPVLSFLPSVALLK